MRTAGEAALTYLASSQALVLQLTPGFVIREANSYACRRLGITPDDVQGKPFEDLLVDFISSGDLMSFVDHDGPPRLLSLSTANRVPESFLFKFYTVPDGVLVIGNLDVDEQRRLGDEVLSLNSELNELTRQLHQANAELEQLNELKDRFLGMAAHDLRHPLGVLITYTDLLLTESRERLTAEEIGFVQDCAEAAHGMARMVDDFLDVSLISAGRFAIDPAPTSCEDLLASAMVVVRVLSDRKQVHVHVDNYAGDRIVILDAPKVQQVLVNLIVNAVEYSRPGQEVQVELRAGGGNLEVFVRDEGPGIDPEDKERLCTSFEKAGVRKTSGERSTGLGLTIARMVVETHGGHIWVDSTRGAGERNDP